jgi:hypothetical protein
MATFDIDEHNANNPFFLDVLVFAPMLVEDLTQVPPPFQIKQPLTKVDFNIPVTKDNDKSDNTHVTFLEDLNSIQDILKEGASRHTTLNREQWLRTAAQLLSAIHTGIQKTHNKSKNTHFLNPESKSDRGPDETDTARLLINATCALSGYFTNPTIENPEYWQQCTCCLMVSKKLVDENSFQAHLVNTNQNVASARATILSQLVTDCWIAFLSLRDRIRGDMHDHMIL